MRGLNALLVAGGNGKLKYSTVQTAQGEEMPEDSVAFKSFMDV